MHGVTHVQIPSFTQSLLIVLRLRFCSLLIDGEPSLYTLDKVGFEVCVRGRRGEIVNEDFDAFGDEDQDCCKADA